MLWLIIFHFAANKGEQMQMQMELAQMATRKGSQLTGPQHHHISETNESPSRRAPWREAINVGPNKLHRRQFIWQRGAAMAGLQGRQPVHLRIACEVLLYWKDAPTG